MTSVDRAFHALMAKRFGTAFTSLSMSRIGPGSRFMEGFEVPKRDFRGNDPDEIFTIHLKMPGLDQDNAEMATFYDFELDDVLLTKFVSSFFD